MNEGESADRRVARLGSDATASLRERVRGAVVLPDDEGYDDARRVWNGTIDRYPAAIAHCTGAADVVEAVTFAREHDLPLAVRGGGHNVAGTAVCDDGVVVDLSEVNDVRVDRRSGTVRVGGGATLADVDRETQLFGLVTPLGAVSKTGVAGLTLNGGLGHLRRKHGLACDNLVSADVVTAAGEVVTASEDDRVDLLWALRGGGGNFGVVTSFEFDLHEVGPEVFALFAWYPADRAVEAFRRFREWDVDVARDASVLPLYAYVPEIEEFPEENWGDPAVALLGCHLGDARDAREAFRPLRNVGAPIADLSGPMPYVGLQRLLDEDYPDGRRYYWKSVFVDELTDDVVDLVVESGADSPSKLSTVDVWQLGGAMTDPDPDATAFRHREKPYMLAYEANWDDPGADDENVEWVRDAIDRARALPVVGGGYGNFPGFNEDPARTVFGDSYDRLAAVKARYDPENRFRLNTNVRPGE